MTTEAAARFTHAASFRCAVDGCGWSMSITGSWDWLATDKAKELINSIADAHMKTEHPDVDEWPEAEFTVAVL